MVTAELPGGLSARPLVTADASAVAALERLSAMSDLVEARSVPRIHAAWSRHDFDATTMTYGVVDGTDLVAFAEHLGGDRCLACIHPAYRDQNLAGILSAWVIGSAAERGQTTVTMHLREESLTAAIARRFHWTERHRSWVLEVGAGRELPAFPPPPGVTIGDATLVEHPTIWSLTQRAYLEGSERRRQSLAEWRRASVDKPGFEPWQLRVARDATGGIIGAAFLRLDGTDGAVERIAVVPELRGKGLGKVLTADAFALLAAHGAVRRSLETSSWQGVEMLQREAGMKITATWVSLAFDVGWPASEPALSSEALAERLGETGGVFLLHRRNTLHAVQEVLRERGDGVVTVDAGGWSDVRDMYATLRSRLRLPRYYKNPDELPEALTELVASARPAGFDRPSFAVVLDRFDVFMSRNKAGALGLVDAFATAARNARIDDHRMTVVLQTADRTLRLTQATVIDDPT